ncbi:hypothetical protein BpHYR1_051931 [Brachionus plicatilis]|uniref:Uncharacterized protein n=1 Tax=Brachionus plicatilis TaxID=10195 RepID=A0A3M7SH33_BRAPC|nr:hypothetical protein BpHYR1_051931 [Brachionus plicatilis]
MNLTAFNFCRSESTTTTLVTLLFTKACVKSWFTPNCNTLVDSKFGTKLIRVEKHSKNPLVANFNNAYHFILLNHHQFNTMKIVHMWSEIDNLRGELIQLANISKSQSKAKKP